MTTRRHDLRRAMAVKATVGAVVLAGLPLVATAAAAHPLGNFTVNTAALVIVGQNDLTVDYAIDMAEIPTIQSGADLDDDGSFDDDELTTFAGDRCDEVAGSLDVLLDGVAVPLVSTESSATASEGSADLPTMRIDCRFEQASDLASEPTLVDVVDRHAAEHIGWHEVVVTGDAMTVTGGDALTTSPSTDLSDYPEGDPMVVTTASAELVAGGPDHIFASSGRPSVNSIIPGVDSMADRLIGDQGRDLTGWSATLLLATAAILGALHAFAPGHGKTVMAAYLLGEQGGSVRQALVLGATVTATHTIGVLTLGGMISLTTLSSPDSIYPWLGITSGLLVAGIGANLLRLAYRSRATGGWVHLGHDHSHLGHDHSHDHHE